MYKTLSYFPLTAPSNAEFITHVELFGGRFGRNRNLENTAIGRIFIVATYQEHHGVIRGSIGRHGGFPSTLKELAQFVGEFLHRQTGFFSHLCHEFSFELWDVALGRSG